MGVGDWLRRLFHRPSAAPSLPEGWTDDMTVPLPPGRTAAEVVEVVIQAALGGTPDDETERHGFVPNPWHPSADRHVPQLEERIDPGVLLASLAEPLLPLPEA